MSDNLNPVNYAENCDLCALSNTRRQVIWGRGSTNPTLMLVGEAPGAWEDQQGKPFVGASGKLLDRLLMETGWPQDQVYITNRVKCRPPENRDPYPGERDACEPWIVMEVNLYRPKGILFLGRIAGTMAHVGVERMSDMHRTVRVMTFGNVTVPTLVTYHPAFALRQGEQAEDLIRGDLELMKKLLGAV